MTYILFSSGVFFCGQWIHLTDSRGAGQICGSHTLSDNLGSEKADRSNVNAVCDMWQDNKAI